MNCIMTIDPGLGGTGYAVWDSSPAQWPLAVHPVKTGVLQTRGPATSDNWLDRAEELAIQFRILLDDLRNNNYKLKKVYVEYPYLMTTSAGMASAQRGDVFKLMFFVGVLADNIWKHHIEFIALPVGDWKGTMKKDVVARRVATRLNVSPSYFPNHTMDAVGIGIYLKGLMNATGTIRTKASSSETEAGG